MSFIIDALCKYCPCSCFGSKDLQEQKQPLTRTKLRDRRIESIAKCIFCKNNFTDFYSRHLTPDKDRKFCYFHKSCFNEHVSKQKTSQSELSCPHQLSDGATCGKSMKQTEQIFNKQFVSDDRMAWS